MKRLLPFFIAGALAVSACGSEGDDTATESSVATTAAAVTTTAAAAATTAPVATTTGGTGAVDLTRLAVGDDQFASTATVGKIFTCQSEFNGGGAQAQGPWFNGDGTWDSTAKIAVQGEVQWDAASVKFTLGGDSRLVTANALPDHDTGTFPIAADDPAAAYDRNPNSISEQTISTDLPAVPALAGGASCIRGEVGIATNGVPIYDGFDAGGRDAVAWEVQDACHGHPQQSGQYHYHDVSPCLDDEGEGHSLLAGYAYDGFGIYGLRGEGGVALTNADLDECHGHTHTIDWDGAEVEMYHYHATAEFPYTVSCFRGTSTQGPSAGG